MGPFTEFTLLLLIIRFQLAKEAYPVLRSGVRFPAEARYFCLLRNVQTGFGVHLAFFTVGTGVISRALTSHPQLALRLGRSSSLTLLPLCASCHVMGRPLSFTSFSHSRLQRFKPNKSSNIHVKIIYWLPPQVVSFHKLRKNLLCLQSRYTVSITYFVVSTVTITYSVVSTVTIHSQHHLFL
jgi:hypothetical protein